jgi:hypothetical protein
MSKGRKTKSFKAPDAQRHVVSMRRSGAALGATVEFLRAR